jgi:hypothetical protein
MRIALCFSFLVGLASAGVQAQCECLWRGSFVDVQHNADLVVSGTVIASQGNSIDFQVSQNLRGEELPEPLLKTADYCRPEVETFPVGTQWVMALHRITDIVPGGFNPNTPSISYGRLQDYSLSSCGGYWLRLSEGMVTGNLVNAPRWERDPPMTPVLLDLVADFVMGKSDSATLLQASKEDPALRELMLDTRSFLRNAH